MIVFCSPATARALAGSLELYIKLLRRDYLPVPPELLAVHAELSAVVPSRPDSSTFAPAAPAVESALMTRQEAARALNVSPSTIDRMRGSGALTTVHLGRSVRIPRAEVNELAKGRP